MECIHLEHSVQEQKPFSSSSIRYIICSSTEWSSIFPWSRYSSVHRTLSTLSTLKLGILIACNFNTYYCNILLDVLRIQFEFQFFHRHLYALPISEFYATISIRNSEFVPLINSNFSNDKQRFCYTVIILLRVSLVFCNKCSSLALNSKT